MRYEEAHEMLKWDSNRNALWELNCRLQNQHGKHFRWVKVWNHHRADRIEFHSRKRS
jgi:hypothetical protein